MCLKEWKEEEESVSDQPPLYTLSHCSTFYSHTHAHMTLMPPTVYSHSADVHRVFTPLTYNTPRQTEVRQAVNHTPLFSLPCSPLSATTGTEGSGLGSSSLDSTIWLQKVFHLLISGLPKKHLHTLETTENTRVASWEAGQEQTAVTAM